MSRDLLGLLSLVLPLREYTKEIDIVWWISSFFTHGKICKSYTGMNNEEMQDKIDMWLLKTFQNLKKEKEFFETKEDMRTVFGI